MYKVCIIFCIFIICNTFVFSNEQQGQLEIVGSISLIAEIEFFHTEAFFLDLTVDKSKQYLAKIRVHANADYEVHMKSQNGGKLVGSGVGNYSVPYQLFYDDMLIGFDETGSYHLFIAKEREEIHTDKVMPGKANELIISFKGNPDLPRNTYHDIITIHIEATMSSGEVAVMRNKLHIRGLLTDSQFLDAIKGGL
ncbi:MAG: hypothetical protein ACQEQU_08530 [Spirochaetota bacterium]